MPTTVRKWYDVPLRTLLVCLLMATILLISNLVGPLATGFVAVFPISTTSTMLILHQRIGGPVTAAVVANGIWGLVGLSIGLSALHYSILPTGPVLALTLALAIPVTWNLYGLGCTDAHAGRTLETTRLIPDRTCNDRAAAGK